MHHLHLSKWTMIGILGGLSLVIVIFGKHGREERPKKAAMNKALVPVLALAGVLATACGRASHSTTSTRTAAPSPSPGVSSPAMSPPFRIKAVKCGRFTTAERNRFSTTARAGLIFRYRNVSNSYTGSPSLTVNFRRGNTVLGSNVNGGADTPDIGPGQNALAEVDAVNGSGAIHFTSCDLISYVLFSGGGPFRVAKSVHVRKPKPSPAPSPTTVAVTFGCKVLQDTSTGAEQFEVTTNGGTYSGIIVVSFYDYAGSGHIFPSTTVQGATPYGSWQPVPAADIGASAEPTGCVASAG